MYPLDRSFLYEAFDLLQGVGVNDHGRLKLMGRAVPGIASWNGMLGDEGFDTPQGERILAG